MIQSGDNSAYVTTAELSLQCIKCDPIGGNQNQSKKLIMSSSAVCEIDLWYLKLLRLQVYQ